MKRPIEEIANANSTTLGLYQIDSKKKKLETQRVGDFIVKALESIHFRIGQDSEQWFGPKFTHQIFGEKEQIMGYEGLSIDVTFSPKYLVPLVQITYQKKAPAFISGDDIEGKLRDHYGKIYTDS